MRMKRRLKETTLMLPAPCPLHQALARAVRQEDTVMPRQKKELVTIKKKVPDLRVWTAQAAAVSGKSATHRQI